MSQPKRQRHLSVNQNGKQLSKTEIRCIELFLVNGLSRAEAWGETLGREIAADPNNELGYLDFDLAKEANGFFARPLVKRAMESIRAATEHRTKLIGDEVMAHIAAVATMDMADAFDSKGNLKNITQMPREVTRAIKSVKVTTKGTGKLKETTTELQFHDKMKALDMANKVMGNYKEDNNQKNSPQANLAEFVALFRDISTGGIPAPASDNGKLKPDEYKVIDGEVLSRSG